MAIDFQLCLIVCHQEDSGKSGWHEIKWYTSVLVYVDDVNILGGSVSTVKKNTKSLVVASKEIGLEINADKTKYLVMSRNHRAGQSHNTETGNSYFESVQNFKYLGTTVKKRNSIHVEIKSRFK